MFDWLPHFYILVRGSRDVVIELSTLCDGHGFDDLWVYRHDRVALNKPPRPCGDQSDQPKMRG